MPKPNTIKIDNQEYVRADSVKPVIYKPSKKGPWQVGKKYFIRTVTHAFHGVLAEVTQQELVLMDAAWIADTKRFSQFVHGTPQEGIEVEPFPRNAAVIINRASLIDACLLELDSSVQK